MPQRTGIYSIYLTAKVGVS